MDKKPEFQHPQSQTTQPAYGQVFSNTLNTSDTALQIEDLTRRIEGLENKRTNFNTDLIGLFETVTVAPTLKPTNPYDQVKISVIAGTTALNIYDAKNSVWKKVTIA